MNLFIGKTYDQERAFYGCRDIKVVDCRFDGPADGESAFKECSNVEAYGSFFNLRYPFWHDNGVSMANCELSPLCRAAFWYSSSVNIADSRLMGIKAMRECKGIFVKNSTVDSAEFGWFCRDINMDSVNAAGEYFMFRSARLNFNNVTLKGKYSFQYIEDSVFDNCVFDTKDAFWHAKNIVVKNSVIKGEYLAWYCENVTFENCEIEGTQPLCYCKNLKLINCRMNGADLSFEKSEVTAEITSPVISIKNPESGYIKVPEVGEIIMDYPTHCEIYVGDKKI